VEIFSDIPWPHSSPPTESLPFSDDDVFSSTQSRLKEALYELRMEILGDEPTSIFAIVVLIVCLLVLFCLIGFVVKRILLLEVDSEMAKRRLRS
jgi:hypothetical protein